jgi:uncharacterized protein (TIGR02118 family)
MIKLNILISRKPGLTLEEFSKHWKEIHGPLFKSQPEVQKHVRHYSQVHSTGESMDQFPTAPYDGIARIWFSDFDGIKAVFGSENYDKYVAPDEAAFIDRDGIQWIYSVEHTIIE